MDNGEVSASDWFKGIGLSVLASVIGGASKLAIRKSWLIAAEYEGVGSRSEDASLDGDTLAPLSLDSDPISEEIVVQQRWSWLPYVLRYSGMFGMSVLNPICCVLAMNYASPSILAPFSGLTLVWVILFSHPVVGEMPSRAQVIAASLIVTGEVVVATFGDHTNDDGVTVEQVRTSYCDPYFVAYLVGTCLYFALLVYWMLFSRNHILKRFAWGSCGGSLTGLQNFLKDSLTIAKATGPEEHYPWFFYLFLAMAGVSAFGGLLFLTACMKRYDATYTAASFVGSFVVSASLMSAAHYKTFVDLKGVLNYILYPTGLVILMVGVYVLVRDSKDGGETEGEQLSRGPVRKNSEDTSTAFDYTRIPVGDDESSGNQRLV
mmetsp:Transcript_125113/g.186910  ORF Transcript_125113/g.186910 Transcript_125113/m.186910 type:complete len:376 (+) Transcript_125113:45-1172(+)|eukprot:CAMPEP_0117012214 /NCGR_PEP_ID=MMETSP0472-20121206/10330_1 /TAXON_ID=693140 ORGANISM="Tiarina fusus, Strain LIS" /NCGR_SAMPLE_ID=MMETSP0472 /ASSEMBLY_ACC=CAM_ASM_000603 /LENGTH=375 /DNA_ID=CAMNT_0004715231 /DNA_START=44 /DNA_END=1171 /DNA_ORIENTATION=-